jgi:hypothetical protein
VIVECGGQIEPTRASISDDGEKWIDVGVARGSRSAIDIAPFVREGQRFRYVRLIDAKAGLSNRTRWPGADIDAVGAIGMIPAPVADRSPGETPDNTIFQLD